MAVKNSVAIPTVSGTQLPADNCIVSIVSFPQPTPEYDDEGNYTGNVVRIINYTLIPYISEASITTEGDVPVSDAMAAFPEGAWSKSMSPAEFTALQADGSLAEQWLAAEIQSRVGGASTVVDPYDI